MAEENKAAAEATQPNPEHPARRKPRPLGLILKSVGALLMAASLICVVFFAWFVEQVAFGSFILLVGWLGGFLLFLSGRALERPKGAL
jgi:uncharacterized YccA/Bax inhibitor family protein